MIPPRGHRGGRWEAAQREISAPPRATAAGWRASARPAARTSSKTRACFCPIEAESCRRAAESPPRAAASEPGRPSSPSRSPLRSRFCFGPRLVPTVLQQDVGVVHVVKTFLKSLRRSTRRCCWAGLLRRSSRYRGPSPLSAPRVDFCLPSTDGRFLPLVGADRSRLAARSTTLGGRTVAVRGRGFCWSRRTVADKRLSLGAVSCLWNGGQVQRSSGASIVLPLAALGLLELGRSANSSPGRSGFLWLLLSPARAASQSRRTSSWSRLWLVVRAMWVQSAPGSSGSTVDRSRPTERRLFEAAKCDRRVVERLGVGPRCRDSVRAVRAARGVREA